MVGKRSAAVVILVALLGLSSCAVPSPLTLGVGSETCTVSDGAPMTFGDVAQVSGAYAAVIESVELIDAEGLELREAYIVPIENQTSLGTDAFPPDPQFWDRRIQIPGAEVEPGVDATVLFVVQPVGDGPHRSAGYRARYTVDGIPHVATSGAGFMVASDCSADDDLE